jgi:CheY-like chemotaxis protein
MKRILLIEDNHNLREEIMNVLELEGFDVRTAENGRVGLTRIEEEVPDLVLCDLMMPDMDGYETLKAIRSNPTTHTLPVILLTARDDEECRSKGNELGANDYVTKPFKIPDLLRAVQAIAKKVARRERSHERRSSDVARAANLTWLRRGPRTGSEQARAARGSPRASPWYRGARRRRVDDALFGLSAPLGVAASCVMLRRSRSAGARKCRAASRSRYRRLRDVDAGGRGPAGALPSILLGLGAAWLPVVMPRCSTRNATPSPRAAPLRRRIQQASPASRSAPASRT